MSIGTALVLLVILLILNAFFVGAEFAMVSARRDQLEPRASEGSTAAKYALKGIEQVSIALAATQLGITACSLLIGAVGEPAIAQLIEPGLESLGVSTGLVHPIALAISLFIVTFLHMVLGEMVPKNIAISAPTPSAMVLGPILHVVVVVMRPVIWVMNTLANLIVRYVLRAEPRDEVESTFDTQQVRDFIDESNREGFLDEDEHRLVSGALTFEDLTAADVVLTDEALHTVARSATVEELEQLCADTGFSRFPVRESDGSLRTYVHTKDVLSTPPEQRDHPLSARVLRELTTVKADMALLDVVRHMQQHSAHIVRVVGLDTAKTHLSGVLMLEDALEMLVGEVHDAAQDEGPEPGPVSSAVEPSPSAP